MGESGGVDAVERALSVLGCFLEAEGPLTLAALARRTGLYKSTILRLIVSLERFGYIERDGDGAYRPGSMLWRLGARYRAGFQLAEVVRPALERLVKETGETASFYVRQGEGRLCLYRAEPMRAIRHAVAEGALLPISRGASGKVLQAWDPAAGAEWAAIREAGFAVSRGERDTEVAAVAAPVFDAEGSLRGAIAVSGLITRFDPPTVERVAAALRKAAAGMFIPA